MTQPVAFITGAAAGIGLATAKELSRRGYAVALLDSDAASLATAAGELQATGAQVLTFPGDVGTWRLPSRPCERPPVSGDASTC
jgi:NAD(P)-dependent dehydrogenase (short-subunit alcohol dehydrogenase family)